MALPSAVECPPRTEPDAEEEDEESSRKVSPFSEWMEGGREEEEGAPMEFADPRLQAYGGMDAEDPEMWMSWYGDRWYWPGTDGGDDPPGLQNWPAGVGGSKEDGDNPWDTWTTWFRNVHAETQGQQTGGGGCAGCNAALAALAQGDSMLTSSFFAALAAKTAAEARSSPSLADSPSESPKQSPGREARKALLLANMLPEVRGSPGTRTPTTSAAASPTPSPSPNCKGADWLFAAAATAVGEPASSSAAPRGVSSLLGSSTMSIGSIAHMNGTCKPCAWFHKSVGCVNGASCKHCHLCPEGALKNKKKAQQAAKSNRRSMPAGMGSSIVGGGCALRLPLNMPTLMSRLNAAAKPGELPQEKAMLEALARAAEAQQYMVHREPSRSPVGARSPPPPPPPPAGSPMNGGTTTTSKVAMWLDAGSQKHAEEDGPVSFNIPANSDQGSTAAPGSPTHNHQDEGHVLNLSEALLPESAVASGQCSAAAARNSNSAEDEAYVGKSVMCELGASDAEVEADGSPLQSLSQWQAQQTMAAFGADAFWSVPGGGATALGSMWPLMNSSAVYGQQHSLPGMSDEHRLPHQVHAADLQEYLSHLRSQHSPDVLSQEILPKLRLEILVQVTGLYGDRILPVSTMLIQRLRDSGWSEMAAKAAPFLCARWPQTFQILPPLEFPGGLTTIILCSEPHWFKGWVKNDSPDTYSKELWESLNKIIETQAFHSTDEFVVAKEIRTLAKDHLLGKQPLGEIAHMLRLAHSRKAADSTKQEEQQPQNAEDLMKMLKCSVPLQASMADGATDAAAAAPASSSAGVSPPAPPLPPASAAASAEATSKPSDAVGKVAGKALLDFIRCGSGDSADGHHGSKRADSNKGGKASSIVGASLLKANPRVGDGAAARVEPDPSDDSDAPSMSAAAAIATITTPVPPPPRPRPPAERSVVDRSELGDQSKPEVCRLFNSERGCYRGEKCRFEHVILPELQQEMQREAEKRSAERQAMGGEDRRLSSQGRTPSTKQQWLKASACQNTDSSAATASASALEESEEDRIFDLRPEVLNGWQ